MLRNKKFSTLEKIALPVLTLVSLIGFYDTNQGLAIMSMAPVLEDMTYRLIHSYK